MKKFFLFGLVIVMTVFVGGCDSSIKETERTSDPKKEAAKESVKKAEDKSAEADRAKSEDKNQAEITKSDTEESEMISELDASREEVNKCELIYRDLLKQYGREFNDCRGETLEIDCEGGEKVNKENNMVLIFDSSGSMAGRIGDEVKIDIAKRAVNNFLADFPDETNLAMIMYGHIGSNRYSDKNASCNGVEIKYELAKINTSSVKSEINKARPVGWTPIEASLEKAKGVLSGNKADSYNNTVLLVTDGIETCDGNPIAKAKELINSDIEVVVDVVGFDVYGESEDKLRQIAKVTGGKYYPARSAGELESTLDEYSKTYCHGLKKYAWGVSKSQLDGAWSACSSRLGEERSDFAGSYSEINRECYPYVSNRYIERRDSIQEQLDNILEENKKYLESINPSME